MNHFAKGAFELDPKKQALLRALLKEEGVDSPITQKISRPQDDNSIPLSFAQQRLWFLEQLQPDTSIYHIPAVFHLKGALNVAALQASFNEILQRHEALRTTFTTVAGQPVAALAPTVTYKLSVVDLRDLPDTEREAIAHKQAIEEMRRPFDLARGPLLRTTLLRLAEEEYIYIIILHHIIADGWSLELLIRELAVFYETFTTNKPSQEAAILPELPIQYADFAHWQRQWLQGEVLETQLSYWKQQLSGNLPMLQLPSDRPRPSSQTFRGKSQSFMLTQTLSGAIKAIAKSAAATLYMVMLAAFKTLLYRYTGQTDILVGSPFANRNRAEITELIGVFVSTLVMRTQLDGNLSFREVLGRVREVVLGADAHQDLPFEKLVDELQPERNLSYSPLFQVMFVLQNAPLESRKFSDLTLEPIALDKGTTQFDLTLDVAETTEGINCRVEYSTDLFDDTTIFRMIGHFQTLLEGIVGDCEQPISKLPLLTEAERHHLLVEWNDTQADYPKNQCIHQLFADQVERTPDAVAVVFEDQQLTYEELNQRANQLAHYLKKLGVKPEVLVGICVERSLEMVVGLLGILKAGGAYVPVDPAYPQERLAFMLSDSQVSVLLTQARLIERLPSHQAQVICLDTDWQVIAQQSQSNPTSEVKSAHLAYVIYTSGSTGMPKGAMNTHQGISNRLLWMQDTYQLTAQDRVLQKTPFSFDVSVWEFFWPLLNGARLVVAQPGGHQDSAYLVELIARQQITTLHFVPSMLQIFLEESGLETLTSLQRVICSGEALSLELQKRFFRRLNAELHNLYGPTEAAIDVTFWQCQRQSDLPIVPIGRAIANTQIYLLDFEGQPVPVGVPGELHIGGDGLARGYLNRPELTAEKFIPHPFSNKPGTRLYKTGDLARYLPNGEIEYIGRIDHQVKVRGFRIELGEIEAVLSQHPQVQTTVVLAWEDKPGSKRLVAYFVPNHNQTPTTSELRNFLKVRLPEYMLPSTFVMLEVLPLTPNGKVNRKALPAPDTGRPELAAAFVAPRTPVEAKLAEIWCEFLGVEQVGIYDNFFELGGDSILSIQIIHKANQVNLQLTPKQLFDNQTIAQLAAVSTLQTNQAEQGLETGQVSLTPIQHWFFTQNQLDPQHWNQAILLEAQIELNPTLLKQIVRQLLVHHDALRLRFIQEELGWQQINASPEEIVPVKELDLSALPEKEQKSAIAAAVIELQHSLNLSEGLLQAALFNLGADQPSRLLLVIHNLVADDISWQILLEDFQTLYEQLSHDEVIHLPAKTTSFKQWANRLSEYAQSVTLQQESDYWLAEAQRQITQLPVDFPGGDNTKKSTCTISVSLGLTETQTLLQQVTSATKTQIDEVLLTALVQAFTKWTGSKKLLVDLCSPGREEIFDDLDLSRTVGCFTTIFPVLLNLGKTSDSVEALKTLKEQLRCIPNRGLGYGILRYLSRNQATKSQLKAPPQAEVSFNYLGHSEKFLLKSPLFKKVRESNNIGQNLYRDRIYLLEINGILADGQLQVNWIYSEAIHRQATVESLAEDFMKALRGLINHCQSPQATSYTPSDFPQAQLNQKDLDKLLAKFNRGS